MLVYELLLANSVLRTFRDSIASSKLLDGLLKLSPLMLRTKFISVVSTLEQQVTPVSSSDSEWMFTPPVVEQKRRPEGP